MKKLKLAEILALNMKILRVVNKLSQSTLAKRAGVSQSTIAQIEIAGQNPSLDVLEKIAKALKVPAYTLLRARQTLELLEDDNEKA